MSALNLGNHQRIMSQAGPALRCLLDEAKHRDAGTFMKSAAMAAEGRVEPPGSIAWALGCMSEILWSSPVDPAAATALRRAIWHPVLDLLSHSAEGTSLEARAIRIAVWLLGHPSSSASPIPQLLRAHSTGSDGSSRSCSSSSSGSSDLLKDASSSLTPRPIVLAVVRALSAFLRTTTSTLRSDLKASAQEIFSYSGKSQSLGDGGGGCSGLKARDGNTNLGERKSAAAETLTAKCSDSSDTDVLPHLVLPTSSVPSQLSSCPMSRSPLITEVGEDFVGDQNIPGDKKTDTVSNGDVRANAPTPEGKEQGMPPCILTAFARTPVTIQALVLVAAATPPSSTSSTSSTSSSSTTTTTNSSSSNGPTVLSSGASQCALCAAVALARIASQKPNENAESTSGSDGNGGGSGSTDGALISSSTTAVVEEEGSYRSLAIEAHWKALPALRQLLHVLRRWVGHPEPSRKRPWAIALDDLSEELREMLEIAEFEDRARVAASAARRDGREDGAKELALEEEARALGVAGRSRLVWLIKTVFPALIEEEIPNRSNKVTLDSFFSSSNSSSKISKSRSPSSSYSSSILALQKAVKSISSMDPMSPHWHIPRDSICARAALQKLGIALGQMKDAKLKECLAASNGQLLVDIQGATTRLLHEKSPGQSAAIHVLATAALQRVYSSPSGPLSTIYAHSSEALALSLLDLLDSTQGASAIATATLVAASAATRPALVLPRLFEKLSTTSSASASKGDSLKRKNALLVVKELFALCPEVRGQIVPPQEHAPIDGTSMSELPTSSAAGLLHASGTAVATATTSIASGAEVQLNDNEGPTSDDMATTATAVRSGTGISGPSLARELGARLLDHLDDEDLELRTFAGSLVALLPPELSVPRLLKAMLPEEGYLGDSDEARRGEEWNVTAGGEAVPDEEDNDEDEEELGRSNIGIKAKNRDKMRRCERDRYARRRAAAEEALRSAVSGPASDTVGAVRAILDTLAYDSREATANNPPDTSVNASKATRSRLRDNLLPRWLTNLQQEGSASSSSPSSASSLRAIGRSAKRNTTSKSSAPIITGKWKDALLTVARRVLAAPDDPTAVGLMAKLASRSVLGCGEAYLIGEIALGAMVGQACLSEEILAGESTAVQQLLFARLAPLLLLKTVPAQSWVHNVSNSGQKNDDSSDSRTDQTSWSQDFRQLVSKIASEVAQRAMQLYEFDEVRRLAAEVLGRLPPCFLAPILARALISVLGLPTTTSLMHPLDSTISTSSPPTNKQEFAFEPVPVASQAKAAVFALCHAIAAHGSQLPFFATLTIASAEDAVPKEEEEETEKGKGNQGVRPALRAEKWMAQIIAHLLAVLLLPEKRPQDAFLDAETQPTELIKLQRGCIDALSFFFQVPFAEAAEDEIDTNGEGEAEGTGTYDDIPSGPKPLNKPLIEELPDKVPHSGDQAPPSSQVVDTALPLPAPPSRITHASEAPNVTTKETSVNATYRRDDDDDDATTRKRRDNCALMAAVGDWIIALLSSGELPLMVFNTLLVITRSHQGIVSSSTTEFCEGARVKLHGLVAKPELNGLMGTVVVEASGKKAQHSDNSRCAVRLDPTSKSCTSARMLSLAKGNLALLEPNYSTLSTTDADGTNHAAAGAAADVATLPESSLRALRICAANALISAFQRADPARVLPRIFKAALPALLQVSQLKETSSKSGDQQKLMANGMSSTLRAASFQGLFVGIFRLPFPSYNGRSNSDGSSSSICPPLARSLLLHTPCVASLFNAALSAIEPPPLVSPISSEPLTPHETTPNAGSKIHSDDASLWSSAEVMCSALKLLMALVARAPRLFEPTAMSSSSNGNKGIQRSQSLVRAVTLPSSHASNFMNSSPSKQAHVASSSTSEDDVFFPWYPDLNGPNALIQCRRSVKQCAMRWQDPLVKKLAAQILEAVE